MINAIVKKEHIEIKIEGSAINLLSELQLLNINVMDEISKCLNVSLYDVFKIANNSLQEIIKEGENENGKSTN